MTRVFPIALLTAFMFLAAQPRGSRADESRPGTGQKRAKQFHAEGTSAFQAENYRQALRAFEDGYHLDPQPEFLLNMAQCHRALGSLDQAIAYLERFIRLAPDHRLESAARSSLRELRLQRGNDPSSVLPSAEPAAVAPDPAPATPPGADFVAVKSPNEPVRRKSMSRWLWVGAGVAILAGAVAVYATTRDDSADPFDRIVLPPP